MNTRSPRVWLIDIREEIAGIQGLTKEADLAAFSASWAMKRAVEHALLIVAEAAKNLPQSMKDARPEVPWAENSWARQPAAPRVSSHRSGSIVVNRNWSFGRPRQGGGGAA